MFITCKLKRQRNHDPMARLTLSSGRYAFFQYLSLLFILQTAILADEVTSSNSTAEQLKANNQTENAYSMFSMVLSGGTAGAYGDLGNKHIVFKNGVVYDEWKPAIEQEANDANADIFQHDEYTDRITFDFFFGVFHSYDIKTPIVTSSDKTLAKPKIIEFQTDNEERSGSFTIVYDCQKSPHEKVRTTTISTILPVVAGLSVTFSFQKVCGGGDHKHLEFGFYEEARNDHSQVSRHSFSSLKETLVVGPHVISTKLYLHLHAPARSQEFFHLTTNTASSNLEVFPKGPVFGGVVTQSESAIIHVMYECHGQGSFDVSIEIPVHPFKPLTATWKKDCGGGVPRGISVGTDQWTSNDVVKNGQSSEKWTLAIHGTSSSISRQAPVLNDTINYMDYWVSNTGFPVHVSRAVATVEKPSILSVFPSTYTRGTLYQFENDGLLQNDEKVRLRLRLVCKRRGRSLVVITLPVKSFTNLEFGFLKECKAPRKYTYSGFLRTADSVMITVAVFMIGAFLYWWKVSWRARASSFVLTDKTAIAYQQLPAKV